MDLQAWEENPHHFNGVTLLEELQMLGLKPDDAEIRHDPELDSGLTNIRFRRNFQRYERELLLQNSNREERLTDHDYYDGDQWDEEDVQALAERGQDALVINRIKPTCDWITGTEKRTRIDYRVLPRNKDDSKGAEVKTKLLKYVADVNKAGHHRSRAFSDAIKSGLGWIEIGIKRDPEDEPLFVRREDWRNVIHDSMSVASDYSDARYLFRIRWLDVDIACAMFPNRVGQILASANSYEIEEGNDVDGMEEAILNDSSRTHSAHATDASDRNRVKLVEVWYKEPEKVKIIKRGGDEFNLGSIDKVIYDPDNPEMASMVQDGMATVVDAIRLRVRQMIFTGRYCLMDQASPYNHNRIPFVPIWAFRKFRDGMPYGVIRNLRDLQYDLNKRRSKALHILLTNQIIADDDATTDWEEMRDEAAAPDGIIRKKPQSTVEIVNQTELVERHVMIMHDDERQIEAAAGVTDENLGRETNATSGKAIQARQDQGHVVTAELFDNLKLAVQLAGEIQLSLVEQFYTERKVVRLTGEKGRTEFEEINAPDPETGEVLNDITASTADFKVDTQDWNATIRQMMFQTMGDLMSKMDTQTSMLFMDMWLELADVPGVDEMVRRVRAINGQPDPDEDENDPEAQAREQAKQEAEAFQSEMEQRLMIAEVEAKELGNDELQAKIRKTLADIRKIVADIGVDKSKADTGRAKVLADIEADERQLILNTATMINGNYNADLDRAARQPMAAAGNARNN